MVQTIAAPPRPARRRRRPRDAEVAAPPPEVPVARATTVRAFEPFGSAAEAARWLGGATASEEAVDAVVGAGIALLNEALHAQAVASADPQPAGLTAERALAVRIGYGSGEETAAGAFSEAREVDVVGGASRRRRRQEELRPQERLAAVLRDRERLAVCEPLLLRARADLDAGRGREAALQLRIGLEALLAELSGSLDHEDHRRDVAAVAERLPAVKAAAEEALRGELSEESVSTVRAGLELAERVLRRRRILAS